MFVCPPGPWYVASGFSGTSPRRLLHDRTELRDQQLLHGQPNGRFRARQAHDDVACGEAGARAAHDRGRSDLLIAEQAEELAEAVEPLLQQAADGFVCTVARG